MMGVLTLGIVGNILSLSVWTRSRLRTGRMAKYMSLLAMADLCTLISGIFNTLLPDYLGTDLRDLNVFSCYFQYFFLGFFACISAWTLIVMTIERFVVIAIPLTSSHCLARCKAPALITVLVILSAMVNTPLVLMNTWDDEKHCVSNEYWDYRIKLGIFTLYSPVPILFLLILNIAIISKMNRFTKRIKKDPDSMKFERKKTSKLMPVARVDTGGVTMIAIRNRYVSSNDVHRSRVNSSGSRSDEGCKRRQHQTVRTIKLSDGQKVVRPSKLITSLSATSRTMSTEISDLASISECTSPEERGLSVASLPDLIIENTIKQDLLRRSSILSEGLSESIASDVSSVFEQETNVDQENTIQSLNSIPDIALSAISPNQTFAISVKDCSKHEGQCKSNKDFEEKLDHENNIAKPECEISFPQNLHNTVKRQRSHSHPPTSAVMVKKPAVFRTRRCSIALMLDNWKTRTSNHMAEKYNKIRSKKMTIMLLAITFSYFILTLPYTVTVYLLVYLSATAQQDHESTYPTALQENIYLAQHFLELLLCVNHSINIFLYCATGSKFRKEFWSMFVCCRGSLKRTDTLSENQSSSHSSNESDSERSASE